jgi:hypothetical protein
MKRLLTLFGTCALILTLGAAPASATKPVFQRGGEATVDLDFPAGAVCDFALHVRLEMKTTLKTFVDANGDPTRGISTGRLHAWETNVETGETQFHSISGPSFFDAAGALVMGTGAWSGIQLQDGTWIRAHGLITFDADSLVTSVRGHVEPLCASFA